MTLKRDPLDEDVEFILSKHTEELSNAEKEEIIKKELKFEKYVSEQKVNSTETDLYNPGVKHHLKYNLYWTQNGWNPLEKSDIQEHYPSYLPTDEAIETILNLEPIIEVGSGNGYWAHVIDKNGGDIVATDINPEQITNENNIKSYDSTYPTSFKDSFCSYTIWSEVKQKEGTQAVTDNPQRNILLCHPSGLTRWSENILDNITTQKLIFVGEWFIGTDANPAFFKKLDKQFKLLQNFPVYDWPNHHARGYVFKRNTDTVEKGITNPN